MLGSISLRRSRPFFLFERSLEEIQISSLLSVLSNDERCAE